MRRTFIILACLITAANIFAGEGLLKGKVSDGKTQEELIGVTIQVKELPIKGVISDIEGNYNLSLPTGKYTVVASYISYTKLEITGIEVKEGEPTILDIDMKENAQELDEVVVVARMDMEAEKALCMWTRVHQNISGGRQVRTVQLLRLPHTAEKTRFLQLERSRRYKTG